MSLFRAYVGGVLVLLTGCGQQQKEGSGVWSQPQGIAKSSDSLSTSFSLYRWNGSLLTLGGDDGTNAARVWEDDSKDWRTISTVESGWKPMWLEPNGLRFLTSWATLWSNRIDARFSIGSFSDGRVVSHSSGALSVRKEKLYPNAQPNLEMTLDERPAQIGFAGGDMEDKEIRVPYCVTATLVERNGRQVGYSGDFAANGVFASSDGGHTWRTEPIVVRYSESPAVCRTKAYYYYFAKAGIGGEPYELWCSRCPLESSAWSPPETLKKSVARKLSEGLHAIGQNETVHLCWLDARNEKTRFSLSRPRAGNYEVAYTHRKDSDSGWSKDVILSKGLRWAYAPSMSVEGNNVVVAWAGAKSDSEGRNEWNASDIYYVISKDGGNTWTKPIRVTDGFKSGVTSGRPQVALHKGVIHLFYIQGKTTYKEVSAGMVKLNQPPWPILYQQRPITARESP